jgi:flagellar biosynthetic protein FliQ
MQESDIVDFFREALWLGVEMVAPLMIAALITGLVIGFMQALTSVQETTLTFAPKLGVMLVVFWLTAGPMGRMLATFFETRVLTFISGS